MNVVFAKLPNIVFVKLPNVVFVKVPNIVFVKEPNIDYCCCCSGGSWNFAQTKDMLIVVALLLSL